MRYIVCQIETEILGPKEDEVLPDVTKVIICEDKEEVGAAIKKIYAIDGDWSIFELVPVLAGKPKFERRAVIFESDDFTNLVVKDIQ